MFRVTLNDDGPQEDETPISPVEASHGAALPLDISANRAERKWSRGVQLARLAWGAAGPLFRLSPRPLWGWRRWLLRRFGAKVGPGAHIYPSVRITMPWNLTIGRDAAVGDAAILYALGPIAIGDRATVSQYAHLCAGTHDWRDPTMPLQKPPIEIGADAWICADAFVGPGVTVGARCIVGARACLMRDLAADHMARGNPAEARPIRRDA